MNTDPAPRQLSDVAARIVASTVKLELVQLLQLHGAQTTMQLTERASADVSRNAINLHIAGLLKDGWISVVSLDSGGRAGRPERTYALTGVHDWVGLVDEINNRLDR
jgi:predicted ArsR family transcriptional regulator